MEVSRPKWAKDIRYLDTFWGDKKKEKVAVVVEDEIVVGHEFEESVKEAVTE